MTPAPLPDTEAARLAALSSYGILDTLPEEAYDDLVAIAAGICDTPLGSVSLIDGERKWIKSHHGAPLPKVPRAVSFGAHAILRPHEVMVVPDTHADERFHHNPLVIDKPSIRFYAGAPLVASGGIALGTLCVMDQTPRQLKPFQIEALRGLSRQVVTLLELRVAHRELHSHLSEREWYERQLQRHEQELIAENAQLTEISRTDMLTGLPNRRAFSIAMASAIATATVDRKPFAMAIVDIDRFKLINDRYGHPAGDKSLTAVAHALKAHCERIGIVARFGGEEFAVVLPGVGIAEAGLHCESMRASVEAMTQDIPLTVSIGIARFRAGDKVSDLYARADEALYAAKRAGRNRVMTIE